ncbi:hypothetical protein F9C11_20865 [Amycolatopsis sp. VS8301801F10]|uniref:hypothetical protein n=1 Tax=Amycolatopsis sp. VS8301801F10 TaxID=2652442 RepID=UPI0038FBEFD5
MPDSDHEGETASPKEPWADTPRVRIELKHLVGGTPADRVEFIRELLEVGELELDSSERRDLAEFFNKVSSAFKFLPMVELSDNRCRLAPGVVAPLQKVLSDDYNMNEDYGQLD